MSKLPLAAAAAALVLATTVAQADPWPPKASARCTFASATVQDDFTDLELWTTTRQIHDPILAVQVHCQNITSDIPFDPANADDPVYAPAGSEAQIRALIASQRSVAVDFEIDPPHMVFTIGYIGRIDGVRLAPFTPELDRQIAADFMGNEGTPEFQAVAGALDRLGVAKVPVVHQKNGKTLTSYTRATELALNGGALTLTFSEAGPDFCYGTNHSDVCPGSALLEVSGAGAPGTRDFVDPFVFDAASSARIVQAFGRGGDFTLPLLFEGLGTPAGFTGRADVTGVTWMPEGAPAMAASSGVFTCRAGACSYVSTPFPATAQR